MSCVGKAGLFFFVCVCVNILGSEINRIWLTAADAVSAAVRVGVVDYIFIPPVLDMGYIVQLISWELLLFGVLV